MSRALRLLATSTALAVSAALIPLAAGSATAAVGEDRTEPTSRVSGSDPVGVTVGDAVSSTAFVPLEATAARATTWPVGSGRADLTQHTTGTPTGAAAQRLVSAKLRFYRARGGVFEGSVRLAAVPDASTSSEVLLAFGRLNSAQTVCNSPDGGNIFFTSIDDAPSADNPVYQGANVRVMPVSFPAAARGVFNCAFAKTAPDSASFPTPYDSLGGNVTLVRQKPILSIRISNRTISSRAFTTIPVVITNSATTVATAYNTRLGVTARGLSYRFNPAVGTIAPGASRRGSIQLKYTTRYTGYFIIAVRSGDYVRRVKYTVSPVRS